MTPGPLTPTSAVKGAAGSSSRAGAACTAQPLPSGSLKKTNEPHANSCTSLDLDPTPDSSARAASDVRDHHLHALDRARRRIR